MFLSQNDFGNKRLQVRTHCGTAQACLKHTDRYRHFMKDWKCCAWGCFFKFNLSTIEMQNGTWSVPLLSVGVGPQQSSALVRISLLSLSSSSPPPPDTQCNSPFSLHYRPLSFIIRTVLSQIICPWPNGDLHCCYSQLDGWFQELEQSCSPLHQFVNQLLQKHHSCGSTCKAKRMII